MFVIPDIFSQNNRALLNNETVYKKDNQELILNKQY